MRWTVLFKGFRGHPLHPPLTDVTVGAFTVGTVATVLARIGLWTDVTSSTAMVALVIGLVFTVPTAATGVADLLDIDEGTPARAVALAHMGVMVVAAIGFFVAVLLIRPDADGVIVSTAAALVAAGSFVVLLVGGWAGGTLAYVYGVRVVGESEAPPGEALRPISRSPREGHR